MEDLLVIVVLVVGGIGVGICDPQACDVREAGVRIKFVFSE